MPAHDATVIKHSGDDEVGDYLARRATEFRRMEVQRQIDLGESDDEIIAAFYGMPDLRKFISESQAPLTMLVAI